MARRVEAKRLKNPCYVVTKYMMGQLLYYFEEQTTCHDPAIGENVVLCWLLLAGLAVYKQDKLRYELISLEAELTLQYKLIKNIATVH